MSAGVPRSGDQARADAGPRADRDYYRWIEKSARIPGGRHAQVLTRAALGNPADELGLAELVARMLQDARGNVLDYGCGHGLLALALAHSNAGAHLTLADDNCVAAEAARRTMERSGIGAPVECLDLPPAGPFDHVAMRLGPGRERARVLMRAGWNALSPGGGLTLAALNEQGARSIMADAAELFGPPFERRAMRHGLGATFVRAPDAVSPLPLPPAQVVTASIKGVELRVAAMPGVFAAGRIDGGTRALLEAIEVAGVASCLDLGSGSGIIGAWLAASIPRAQIVMVDSSATAVACSRRTLELNGLANARVMLGDVLEPLRGQHFDLIACNPPFHRGGATEHAIAAEMIRAAHEVAAAGARFYLVANRFLRYEAIMERHWPGFATLAQNGRFKVLRGVAS